MVSQFISSHEVALLGDLDFEFPPGTHAIGRLDNHSEGLLLLTTNKKITRLLFESSIPHKRTYLVQAKNLVSAERLEQLRAGIPIRVKGGGDYTTTPCDVVVVESPGSLFMIADNNKVFYPYTWVLITLTEGKFHQVRKMFAAIHHRCKRLIRVSIEGITLESLSPGGVKEMTEKDFFEKLNI